MGELIYFAIPIFGVTMLVEWALGRKRDLRGGYQGIDTAASLSMGLGNVLISLVMKFATLGLYQALHRIAPFDIQPSWWALLLIIPCEDFCYYWFHRTHHEVRLLWAAHVNHHSSTHYNLSTALRQSWTTPITGFVFWAPLALIGFDPLLIITAQSISLLYQYWIHTELIDRLGRFEWLFNTPSHHRVHHGRNVEYLDRNYAGIFMLWDRLFGSFEPELAPVDYGITKNLDTFNPIRIAFHEWLSLAKDVFGSRSALEAMKYCLARPGWKPDGAGQTAPQLRRALHKNETT